MHRKIVDFPEPLGPIIPRTSPFSTVKEISFSTSTPSAKVFFKFFIVIISDICFPIYNTKVSFQVLQKQEKQASSLQNRILLQLKAE